MDRKGQALVEFVLILPVFLMILFAIIDFGVLAYSQNRLQNESTDIIRFIQNGDTLEEITRMYPEIDIKVNTFKEKYQKVKIVQEISLITPFLERVLGETCSIEVERVIPNVE